MRYVLILVLLAACGDDPHEVVACDPSWQQLGIPLTECEAACAPRPTTSPEVCAYMDGAGVQKSCASGYQATFDGEAGCCVIESMIRVGWHECE